jgi:hypothetical protein
MLTVISIIFSSFFLFIFFARPKKTNQKKGRPASRLILRVAETGGALSNSAPKQQGPQTAKGPVSARFCDARRGTMGYQPKAQRMLIYGF